MPNRQSRARGPVISPGAPGMLGSPRTRRSGRLAVVPLVVVMLLGAAAVAEAGRVKLKSGQYVYGVVVNETSKHCVLLMGSGLRTFAMNNVEKVEPRALAPAGLRDRVVDVEEVDRESGRLGGDSSSGAGDEGGLVDSSSPTVELVVQGAIGSRKLDSNHERTRTRMAYFLVHDAKPPMLLLSADEDGESSAVRADYRITLNIQASYCGQLTFFGLRLGAKFRGSVKCKVEKLAGNHGKVMESLSTVEDVTSTNPDRQALAEQVAEMAAAKLVERLKGLRTFKAESDRRP